MRGKNQKKRKEGKKPFPKPHSFPVHSIAYVHSIHLLKFIL